VKVLRSSRASHLSTVLGTPRDDYDANLQQEFRVVDDQEDTETDAYTHAIEAEEYSDRLSARVESVERDHAVGMVGRVSMSSAAYSISRKQS